MKIALIQFNPVIGDFAANTGKMLEWINRAKQQDCGLAVLPELAISGYPPQDLLERPAFLSDHEQALNHLIENTKGIGVLCGTVTRHTDTAGKSLHNSAILFEDGDTLFVTQKRLLPTYDVFDETRYFEAGRESHEFTYKGLNLAITICEDIWNDKNVFDRQLYAVDPVYALMASASRPLDILINIAASPFNLGKVRVKQKIFSNICGKYGLPLLYVNQVGGQDSLVFDGGSLAMSRDGNIVAQAAMFCEDMVVIDTDSWQGDIHDTDDGKSRGPFSAETARVHDALVVGTRDYVTKCGFSKVVIGLSLGVDSALTAAIACEALGPENAMGVAMPGPYSSKESIEDAHQLAANLGMGYAELPISDIFTANLKALAPFLGDLPPDITEQNIQARIRGNMLMALANKFRWLVLSTGNKSEMAVGYCTLYGDMSGGLAVISDVPKMLVYELSRYVNRRGEIIPARVLSKPPSAELAPGQKDDDDLPPYTILDQILKAYLEDNLAIREIVAMGFDHQIVEDVVRRIKINEYKRKQAPLGLKVTTKAFGYGRRYPTAENYREDA
jgi:NAD+ synthetase